jgi:hypothetical protein
MAAFACALAMVVCAGGASAEQPRPAQPPVAQEEQSKPDSHVHVFHAQGNVYMLVEPTNNITVQIGEKYVIVVDTGVPELSDEVIAAIRSLSSLPIMFIVNTSADADHTGGDPQISQAGWALPNAGSTGVDSSVSKAIVTKVSLGQGAPIVGHKNTVDRNGCGHLRQRRFPALQRRAGAFLLHACGAHRWRHGRVFPRVGSRQRGRSFFDHRLPGDRVG